MWIASGWLALCHSTATGQWLAAQIKSTPALRAPVDHPPRPANKSIAVVMVCLPFRVGLGQRRVDTVAAFQYDVGQCRPVFMAVTGLTQQAEIAVGGFTKILGGRRCSSLQRLGQRTLTGYAAPRLDDVANEVDAAIYRLQDGLSRVQLGA